MEIRHMQLIPIGIIHSPFKEAPGTPIQPIMASGMKGTVEVFPEYREGLKDLEGFERIWLIYCFHLAKPTKLLAKPFLDTVEHGIFAIRGPSRPNPIGMSCVKLISVNDGLLQISEIDVIDETPLLDIKPYATRFDSYDNIKCGWLDNVKNKADNTLADSRFCQ